MLKIAEEKNAARPPSGNFRGRIKAFILLALLAAAPLPSAYAGLPLAGGTLSIRRNLLSGGGAVSTGPALSLNCALGEAAVGTFTGAGFKFSAGYMPLAAQPGTVISITAVTKTTGTLELAWTAPGLDGFQGGVAGGIYRIDTSSDAAHVFDPSVFVTEFSTSVTPGDPQVYVSTGLQPNTTYYTRIYLGDSRKVLAETSAPADESTLTNLPVSPVLSGVFTSSATFTWTIPAGDAEGYLLETSSTNFGALFPGGALVSSMTRQGLSMTLTVTGLADDTTYYFRLGSLNWAGSVNFDTILTARTLVGRPTAIQTLAIVPDALSRKVMFRWSNRVYPDPAGVLIQVSTQPITAAPADGVAYGEGGVFPDGSVVLSSAAAAAQLHAALELDTTYYYRFSSQNTAHAYSVFVSTECLLDLPPMAPAGLQASLDTARSSITVSWAGVSSNIDGSRFTRAAEPLELARYDIYRATGIVKSSWTLVASAPISASSVTIAVPDADSVYFYKVVSMDSIGTTVPAMVVDTDQNLYAVAPDQVSRLKIPAAMTGVIQPAGNPSGSALFVSAVERVQDEGGKVIKSIRFEPLQAPSGAPAEQFRLNAPSMDVVLHYETANGQVLAGSAVNRVSAALAPSVSVANAPSSLGSYWFNGKEYVKVFGDVDAGRQTVTVQSAFPGTYQIRSLARSSGVEFDVKEISNKVITPNGDGLNDYTVFTIDNPRDSALSGKIYDLTGAFVADMKPGTQIADTLVWDGKAEGRVVPRGVYIYQIKAEDRVFNGTILVIR